MVSKRLFAVALGLVFLSLSLSSAVAQQVEMKQETLVLPTYEMGAADPTPMFYDGRGYQGAKGPVYPYAILDRLTREKKDHPYKAIFLENQYVQISVLPEIGGRLFTGLDKTNAYDFFYRQHVIKPALVGMLGAWISGGVEWNIPHHHRASSFMPVDYRMVENPDGSKTVWVGETEWRHRMRWIVGLTVYPGRSFVEAKVRLFNRTPYSHSYLYWANPAVHANEQYQVIFPPSVQFATFHSKNQFARWPVAAERYNGVDYAPGTDISWWKNHPNPTSFFAWQAQEDFLAGYDHGKNAGIVHVSDHHQMPGKKFWEWGNGPEGRLWDKVLTDADGPYIELMVGGGSDNQPDYSWIQPGQTREFVQYWYPIRDIGGVKAANRDAALNLEIKGNQAILGVNTTASFENALVRLERALAGSAPETIFEQRATISPDRPFKTEVALPQAAVDTTITVVLLDGEGKELIRYRPQHFAQQPMPERYAAPRPPSEIKSNEELYLAGLRLVQFYNPSHDPYPYFEEALRRDPGDARSNTMLGHLYLLRGMYPEAERHLRAAVDRLSSNYTTPKDLEANYLLGVTLKQQGRNDEAEKVLGRASWGLGWGGAAFYEMAELAARKGHWNEVRELTRRSLELDTTNPKATALLATAYRYLGLADEAQSTLTAALKVDPLNPRPLFERLFTLRMQGMGQEYQQALIDLRQMLRGENQAYLEVAVDYANAGLYSEAMSVLATCLEGANDPKRVDALVYYHLADYLATMGDRNGAQKYYGLAQEASPEYVFPFRFESVPVLQRAMSQNPEDGRAAYYLGNLLFDHQPEVAMRYWEQAAQKDPSNPMVFRNLAFGASRGKQKDLQAAIAWAEKGIAVDASQPRPLFELDEVYEDAGIAPEKRLEVLNAHRKTVESQDYLLARLIRLYIATGQPDQAIALLSGHHFHNWEGGEGVHQIFEDAYVTRAIQRLDKRNYRGALADLNMARTYPDNIEAAPDEGEVSARIQFLTARAQEGLKNRAAARAALEQAANGTRRSEEEARYRAMAREKLGQTP